MRLPTFPSKTSQPFHFLIEQSLKGQYHETNSLSGISLNNLYTRLPTPPSSTSQPFHLFWVNILYTRLNFELNQFNILTSTYSTFLLGTYSTFPLDTHIQHFHLVQIQHLHQYIFNISTQYRFNISTW